MKAEGWLSPRVIWIAGIAAAVIVVTLIVVSILNNPPRRPAASGTPTSSPTGWPSVSCSAANVTVGTARALSNALSAAKPGTIIRLDDGVYPGNFTGTGNGTPDHPIVVCGTDKAILDGGNVTDGYVFHLDRASYWVLQGFTVRNGQKGVMVDGTSHSTVKDLTVTSVGDEGIHLRDFSTFNTVVGNRVRDTGLRKPKFGEGIYVGTAQSNWCSISNCQPDRSDSNTITGNNVAGTTAESVDIKEGTSSGVLSKNTFDGSTITAADSWVDVKGDKWLIEDNTGTNSPGDGFQTHQILAGWGTDNVFRDNTAQVNGPGVGYSLTPANDNVVECNNKALDAAKGSSNVACSSG
jgi:hypothetical protein